jgi:hypothetical protein
LRAAARHWAGDDLCELPAEPPAFLWLFGSTMVEAAAEPDGSVVVRAFLVLGPDDRNGLDDRLERLSATLPFGRLEIDEDGDVALVHRVPAEAGARRLHNEIRDVCCHADVLDDILCDQIGGIRSVDQFQSDVLAALGEGASAVV